MRKQLICWGLAAWLFVAQTCPAFAGESVAGFPAPQGAFGAGTEPDDFAPTPPPGTVESAPSTTLPPQSPETGASYLPASPSDNPILSNIPAEPDQSEVKCLDAPGFQGPTGYGKSFGGRPSGPSPEAPENFPGAGLTTTSSADEPPAPSPPPPPTVTFIDVPDIYLEYVLWAVSNGITNGTTSSTFSPYNPCTHWHILTFLWRRCVGSEEKLAVAEERERIVLWAQENGLIDSAFNGNKVCTRGEAMRYIWILSGRPSPSVSASFSDMPADTEKALAISWAVEMKIASGYKDDNTFRPDNDCTRAHIVKFLYMAWSVGALGQFRQIL